MYELCLTSEWPMSSLVCALMSPTIWMNHVSSMNESFLIFVWAMSYIWMGYVTPVRVSTYVTYKQIMSHIHDETRIHEWSLTCFVSWRFLCTHECCSPYKWIVFPRYVSHIHRSYFARRRHYVNEPCRTIRMSHVSHIYESRIYESFRT